MVGWIKDATNSFEAGLHFLAACALMGGVITWLAPAATGRLTRVARERQVADPDR